MGLIRGTVMRKTAITLAGTTAIGLCLGVSAGSAADMALPLKAAPVVPFTWTGCYVGVQAGIGAQTDGFANTSGEFDTFGTNGANGLGAIAGGQIGCNYQINQLVVGIEGDGVWSSIQNTSSFANTDGEGTRMRTRNLWDADVALRVGAAFDRLLVYGKGGVAWGGFDFKESFFGPFASTETFDGSRTLPGLLIGVGMEYAFLANWSAKIEYNYIAYEQTSIGFNGTTGSGVIFDHFSQSFGATKQIIKFGVNYKFY
jgi:outer membrane immunogenic protein